MRSLSVNTVRMLLLTAAFLLQLTSTACADDQVWCGEDYLAGCGEGCDTPSYQGLFQNCADVFTTEMSYTADVFANTRGGRNSGTGLRYKGLLDLVVTMDLDAANFGPGGRLVAHGVQSHGEFLNDFVGATQDVTNIDAPPFTALGEYFWETDLANDSGLIRIGRQNPARMFSVLGPAASFINPGFVKSPNNAVPWYPAPTLGASSQLYLSDQLDARIGVFAGGDQVTQWGWHDRDQIYSVAQLNRAYDIDGRPGDLQVGFWHQSGTHGAIGGGNVHRGNHGFYMGWDQLIWNERCNPDQGLSTFLIYSWAPGNRNRVNHHYATGLVYRGLIDGRDDDLVGVGLSIIDHSDRLNIDTESTIEVYYRASIGEYIFVQPDLQYISSPGGVQADALFVGFRFAVDL